MLAIAVIAALLVIIGVLNGWGIPLVAKSERPYGLLGDVLASTLTMLVVGLAEWILILPALAITGWLAIVASIGDAWGVGLIVLWLMRRVKS